MINFGDQARYLIELNHHAITDTTVMEHVVIVGGGVMGLSIAYSVAKRGIKVTLIDASSPDTVRSSRGDSRGLQYGYEGIYSDLVNESADLWEKLEREDPSNRQVSVTVSAYVYVLFLFLFLFLFVLRRFCFCFAQTSLFLFMFLVGGLCFCSVSVLPERLHVTHTSDVSVFFLLSCFLSVFFVFYFCSSLGNPVSASFCFC